MIVNILLIKIFVATWKHFIGGLFTPEKKLDIKHILWPILIDVANQDPDQMITMSNVFHAVRDICKVK